MRGSGGIGRSAGARRPGWDTAWRFGRAIGPAARRLLAAVAWAAFDAALWLRPRARSLSERLAGTLAALGHTVALAAWQAALRLARRARRRPREAFVVVSAAILCAALLLIVIRPPEPTPPRADHLAAQLDCLALNIYHEARGESEAGRLAVAQVVMNRVADPRFPNDICAVVKQPGARPRDTCQFSWWCDGLSDRPRDLAAWEQSKALARQVMDGHVADPTRGALWYHAETVRPKWGMAIAPAGKIGRHLFYAPAAERSEAPL